MSIPVFKPYIKSNTINAALNSKYISRLVVTTDSKKYSKIASAYGADIPFIRNKSLSTDNVHSVYAILDVLNKLKNNESYIPDIVLMLLPTSPLRSTKSIDSAIKLFLENNSLSLVSVVENEKQLLHLRTIDKNGILKPIIKSDNYNVQREDLDSIYSLNGSIYISTPKQLTKTKTFHNKDAMAFLMPKNESVDINDQGDFDYAEYLLNKNY